MARADLAHGGVMRLGLSSAAAPDTELATLLEVSRARGLELIELREGDACLADPDVVAGNAAAIAGIVARELTDGRQLATLSTTFDADVLIPGDDRLTLTNGVRKLGGRALPLMSGPAAGWIAAVLATDAAWAWDADATLTDLARDADLVLRDTRRIPSYVRLIGGGPETSLHEGRGVGTLMGRLALAGYAGPLILVPSSPRFRVAWSAWLGRRGGWGCGSRTADTTLVTLS